MNSISRFAGYLKKYKKQAIVAPLCMILVVIGDLAQPYLTQKVIDNGIQTGDLNYVIRMGIIMVVISILGFIAGIINIISSSRLSVGFATDLRQNLFSKIQELSYGDIDRLNTGNLIVRLTNDITQLQNFVMQTFRILIRSPITGIGALILAIKTSLKLSPIIVVLIVIVVITLFIVLRKSFPLFIDSQQALDNLNRALNENLSGIRAVKAFVREDFEIEKFDKKNIDLTKKTIKSSRSVATIIPLLMLTLNFATVAVLWFGGNLFFGNNIQIGEIVAFTNYLLQLMMSLVIAGMLIMSVSRAVVSGKRIMEVFDTNPEIQDKKDAIRIEHVKGDVSFEHVYFSYDDTEEWVLEDVNFNIKAGELVGVIGATGSGKSTLVQLIPRLYDVDKGKVTIDGIDVKDIKEKSLRENVSIVLQKAILFSGTILENIKYGNQEAKLKQVKDAAMVAQAQEFIDRFTEKYDTVLYQKGSNLSGGQRQRVSIARGLVKDPSILILDDSTSALDAKSEALVKHALNRDFADTTTIIIAQKISSVIDADKIIVLEKGKVVSEGTHDELLKTSTVYQDIYKSQLGKEV